MQNRGIAVTGTDTDVGKTILSLLIMQYLFRLGENPIYLKPFQTGCTNAKDKASDAAFIFENIRELDGKKMENSLLNCYKNPKAPFFAAHDMGLSVDVKQTLKEVEEKSKNNSYVILEGAGGLYVPLSGNATMLDFLEKITFKTVVAARAGLGTINHTLLTIESLRNKGIEPAGIVFMNGGKSPVPQEMLKENMEAVKLFSGLSVTGVIGRIDDFKNPEEECYNVIASLPCLKKNNMGKALDQSFI